MDPDDLWGDGAGWAGGDDDEDEDGGRGDNEDEDDEDAVLAGAHHVMLLVDCHPDMFVPCITDPDWPDDDKISPMDAALKACERFFANKLRTVASERAGKRDGCGMVLYGTRSRPVANEAEPDSPAPREKQEGDEDNEDDSEEDDESDFGGPVRGATTCHELLPLEPPGIAQYKTIRDCLDDPVLGRERDLQAEYGHDDISDGSNDRFQEHPLKIALLDCGAMFRRAKCVKKKTAAASSATATPSTVHQDDIKELWIFTNQDNPTKSNEQVLPFIVRAAKDVKGNDIQIVLWPLPKPDGTPFDRTILFDEIAPNHGKTIIHTQTNDDDDEETKEPQHVLCVDDMLEIFDRERKKMRRIFYAPLFLPTTNLEASPGIMLDFYRHVRIHTKPTAKHIHQEKKKETVTVRDVVDKETGELIFTTRPGEDNKAAMSRMRYFAKLGDDRVPLTAQEALEMKKKSNVLQKSNGLVLWGFKKFANPFHYTVEPAYFVYPNDEHVKGSTKAFANLHAAMLRKGVIGYGELLTRVSTTPRLVEIHAVPEVREQLEVEDEDGAVVVQERQVSPPGFTLFVLPFADEIRDIAPDKASEAAEAGEDIASEEAVAAAMELMKGLKLEDVELGERFENAALMEFWNYVESVALDMPRKDGSKRQYETEINEAEVLERVGTQIENFKLTLPEDEVVESGSRKRKPAEDKSDMVAYVESLYRKSQLGKGKVKDFAEFLELVGVGLKKKTKKKEDYVNRVSQYFQEKDGKVAVKEEDMDEDEEPSVEHWFRKKQLSKCTVSQLKDWLTEKGHPVKGKKADLIDRATELLSNNESDWVVVKKEEESDML